MLACSSKSRPSAKLLAKELGWKLAKQKGELIRVNLIWGNPEKLTRQVLPMTINKQVSWCVPHDKLTQLNLFKMYEVPCPEFTTDKAVAATWKRALARQVLTGHSGVGIEEFKGQNAPLYTEYIPKKEEFRVHYCYGKFDIQQKKRRRGVDANPTVRNLANGWVYCRDINLTDEFKQRLFNLAKQACEALTNPWGAVDIIYNQKRDKLYVLEVNSAPGLEGTTVKFYADAIKEACK